MSIEGAKSKFGSLSGPPGNWQPSGQIDDTAAPPGIWQIDGSNPSCVKTADACEKSLDAFCKAFGFVRGKQCIELEQLGTDHCAAEASLQNYTEPEQTAEQSRAEQSEASCSIQEQRQDQEATLLKLLLTSQILGEPDSSKNTLEGFHGTAEGEKEKQTETENTIEEETHQALFWKLLEMTSQILERQTRNNMELEVPHEAEATLEPPWKRLHVAQQSLLLCTPSGASGSRLPSFPPPPPPPRRCPPPPARPERSKLRFERPNSSQS